MFEFPEFSVLEEDNNPEYHHLQDSSNQGNLSGVEAEPGDCVVVQDVNNVGGQDQSHSAAESSPGNRIKTIISSSKVTENLVRDSPAGPMLAAASVLINNSPTFVLLRGESKQSTI